MDVWSVPAKGVDLRPYTNSTLHWIGCPDFGETGCDPDEFYCEFDPTTQTLSFGSTAGNASSDALRAVVDPNNINGNAMPDAITTESGFCTAEMPFGGVCNAPDINNNDVPIDTADALCFALGYQSGSMTWVNENFCPEANTITADGSNWTSDFVESNGYGKTYTCIGFRVAPTSSVPAITGYGLIATAVIIGIAGFMVIRRRKVSI